MDRWDLRRIGTKTKKLYKMDMRQLTEIFTEKIELEKSVRESKDEFLKATFVYRPTPRLLQKWGD